VWSLPVRFDSEGDGASDETEWKFHGNPDSSDSDKDGIPDREESGPNLTMVEGTPPVILDKKGRDSGDEKYGGAYISAKIKPEDDWNILGAILKAKIAVAFTVTDNGGLDKAVIWVESCGKEVIYLAGGKAAKFYVEFEIGEVMRLIYGGFDIKVNVTDINGNWATGKTHINSALGALKKGIYAVFKMIKEAFVALAKVITNLFDAIKELALNMINVVIERLKTLIEDFVNGVAESIRNGYHNAGLVGAFVGVVDAVFNSALYWTLLILITVLLAIEVIVTALCFGATSLIGPSLVLLIKPIIISAILGYVAHETSDFLEEHGDGIRSFLTYLGIPLTIIDASLFIYKAIGGRYVKKGADITKGDIIGFVYGILGLILVVSEKAFGYSVDPVLGLFLDIVGLYLSFKGAYEAFKGKLDFASWVGKLAEILAYVSLGVSIADFLLEDYSDAYEEITEVV